MLLVSRPPVFPPPHLCSKLHSNFVSGTLRVGWVEGLGGLVDRGVGGGRAGRQAAPAVARARVRGASGG